jgi:xanthine dehydrogenase YagS FAD-binding subunit
MDGDTVVSARIALGGVASKPWRARDAETSLAGAALTLERALEAGRVAFADARPLRHNAFKIELGRRAVARALMTASKRS